MTEQLVSFETAKLAKEKGFVQHFDGPLKCMLMMYHIEDKILKPQGVVGSFNDKYYYAPTQSLLQKWIRENHFLHIVLIPTITCDMTFKIVDIQCNPEHEIERPPYKNVDAFDYRDYESALEAGLKEALNLIK